MYFVIDASGERNNVVGETKVRNNTLNMFRTTNELSSVDPWFVFFVFYFAFKIGYHFAK